MALRSKIYTEAVPDRKQPLSIHKLNVELSGSLVLKNLSCELAAGEILGITGPNGAGKTTLVSALAGTLNVPDENIVCEHTLFEGEDLLDLTPQQRYIQGVHCVFEGRRLFTSLTVRENLAVAMARAQRKNTEKRINEILELFPKMKELLDIPAGNCSGGQQQIVAIARAIMVSLQFSSLMSQPWDCHQRQLQLLVMSFEFLRVDLSVF